MRLDCSADIQKRESSIHQKQISVKIPQNYICSTIGNYVYSPSLKTIFLWRVCDKARSKSQEVTNESIIGSFFCNTFQHG